MREPSIPLNTEKTDPALLSYSSTSINVIWDPPSKPNGIITHYAISLTCLGPLGCGNDTNAETFETTGRVEVAAVGIGVTQSLNLTGLHPATTLQVQIASKTATSVFSANSFSVSTATLEAAPAGPPTDIAIEATGSASFSVNFGAPLEKFRNGIITKYEVLFSQNSTIHPPTEPISLVLSTLQFEALPTVFTLEETHPNTDYDIRVRAYTSVIEPGVASSPPVRTRTLPALPTAAPILVGEPQALSNKVTISWSAPPAASINGVLKAIVGTGTRIDGSVRVEVSPGQLGGQIEFTGLAANRLFKFDLQAENEIGTGPAVSIFVKTAKDLPGSEVQNVTVFDIQARKFSMSWGEPVVANGNISHFDVIINGFFEAEGSTPDAFLQSQQSRNFSLVSKSTTFTGLLPFTTYSVFIAAVNEIGRGPLTEKKVVTAESAPAAVKNLGIDVQRATELQFK